jgi:hypothetical protein
MKLFALLAASLILSCTLLVAQDSDEQFRGPDRGTSIRVHGIEILPNAGKPFSGRDHIEWTRTLEDGSVVTMHLDAFLARDGQGRIYREHVNFVPANSNRPSRRREFDLLDPVAHTRTVCITATRHCTITGYNASTSFTPTPAGPLAKDTRYLSRESLGAGVVDDLNAIGTRETLTINAGVVGNTQPLVATKEFWFSPDLQVNLSVTRKDPREGTQVIHVEDLSRSEPEPGIFQVPHGFVVQDIRQQSATNEN